jgi:hypothetical protein
MRPGQAVRRRWSAGTGAGAGEIEERGWRNLYRPDALWT